MSFITKSAIMSSGGSSAGAKELKNYVFSGAPLYQANQFPSTVYSGSGSATSQATYWNGWSGTSTQYRPSQIHVHPSGTSWFFVQPKAGGALGNSLYQVFMSTAWEMASADGSTPNANKALGVIQNTNNLANAVEFKPDGTKCFVMVSNPDPATNSVASTVQEVALSTPWDVTTASVTAGSYYTMTFAVTTSGIRFNPSGLSFSTCDVDNGRIETFVVSSAWDLSSTVTRQTTYVDNQSGTVSSNGYRGLFYNNTGTILWRVSDTGDLFGSNLNTAYRPDQGGSYNSALSGGPAWSWKRGNWVEQAAYSTPAHGGIVAGTGSWGKKDAGSADGSAYFFSTGVSAYLGAYGSSTISGEINGVNQGFVQKLKFSTPYLASTADQETPTTKFLDLGANFRTARQIGNSVSVSGDGTKLFSLNADYITSPLKFDFAVYTLSTPYDIHTAGSPTAISFADPNPPSTTDTGAGRAFEWGDNGSSIFIVASPTALSGGTHERIIHFTVSVPYDLTSTVSKVSEVLASVFTTYGTNAALSGIKHITWRPDGTGFYLLSNSNLEDTRFNSFTVTTPWTLNGVTRLDAPGLADTNKNIVQTITEQSEGHVDYKIPAVLEGLWLAPDGKSFFVLGKNSDTPSNGEEPPGFSFMPFLRQYNISAYPWQPYVETASGTRNDLQTRSISQFGGVPTSVSVSGDQKHLYLGMYYYGSATTANVDYHTVIYQLDAP